MNPETEARANDLAEAHWNYIEGILAVHNVTVAVIAACGYHYKTAFVHGYKHALEDIASEHQRKQFGRVSRVEPDLEAMVS